MLEFARLAFYLVSPFTLGLVLAAVALMLGALRRRRAALGLGLAALILVWCASIPWVAHALARPLEAQYAGQSAGDAPSADAIVMLGGALGAGSTPGQSFDLGPAADRVWHAAALYRAGKAPVVIVAAGPRRPGSTGWVEADGIREMLQVLGVPARAILSERTSSDTRENARFTEAMVRQLGARRVLLVTSALHMPRAMRTFGHAWRGNGVEILAAPTDFQPPDDAGATPWSLLPRPDAAARTHNALKEHVGLIALAIMQ